MSNLLVTLVMGTFFGLAVAIGVCYHDGVDMVNAIYSGVIGSLTLIGVQAWLNTRSLGL